MRVLSGDFGYNRDGRLSKSFFTCKVTIIHISRGWIREHHIPWRDVESVTVLQELTMNDSLVTDASVTGAAIGGLVGGWAGAAIGALVGSGQKAVETRSRCIGYLVQIHLRDNRQFVARVDPQEYEVLSKRFGSPRS